MKLIDTVCRLAGDEHLVGNQSSPKIKWLRRAIAEHDTGYLFEQLMEAFSLQGISDHAAYTYMERHGRLTWRDMERATARLPICPKLRSYWTFESCGYRKEAQTCAKPEILSVCPVPKHDLRNGRLNQTGYGLFLFIRDITNGDLVRWIDGRIEEACEGSVRGRSLRMRKALIEPLGNLPGVGAKVLNMTLASLLIAAPPNKQIWLEAGIRHDCGRILLSTLFYIGPDSYNGSMLSTSTEHLATSQTDARSSSRGLQNISRPENSTRTILDSSPLCAALNLALLRTIGVEHLQRKQD